MNDWYSHSPLCRNTGTAINAFLYASYWTDSDQRHARPFVSPCFVSQSLVSVTRWPTTMYWTNIQWFVSLLSHQVVKTYYAVSNSFHLDFFPCCRHCTTWRCSHFHLNWNKVAVIILRGNNMAPILMDLPGLSPSAWPHTLLEPSSEIFPSFGSFLCESYLTWLLQPLSHTVQLPKNFVQFGPLLETISESPIHCFSIKSWTGPLFTLLTLVWKLNFPKAMLEVF